MPRSRETTAPAAISLAHPAFVVSLALLLANDLVLKAAHPGWLTGKLSDFAGLFVLPFFLAWLWPARRRALHVGVAIAFVAWKLPVSRPFVDLWNVAPWFDIARVEDVTDLVALIAVAASSRATGRGARHHAGGIAAMAAPTVRVLHLPNVFLAGVALVALTATSYTYDAPMRGTFLYPGTFAQFRARLAKIDAGTEATPNGMRLVPPWRESADYCENVLRYDVVLSEFPNAVLVRLTAVRGRCVLDEAGLQVAVRTFNERFVLPLGLQPAHRVVHPTPATEAPSD